MREQNGRGIGKLGQKRARLRIDDRLSPFAKLPERNVHLPLEAGNRARRGLGWARLASGNGRCQGLLGIALLEGRSFEHETSFEYRPPRLSRRPRRADLRAFAHTHDKLLREGRLRPVLVGRRRLILRDSLEISSGSSLT
jgi:hypothetical protein